MSIATSCSRPEAPAQPGKLLFLDADLRLRGTQVPLGGISKRCVPRTSGHVVGRWDFASLRWLGNFFNAPWLALDGSGAVDADVQVVDGKVAAGSRIGVPEVDAVAHVMGNRIQGRARAAGRLDAGKGDELLPSLELVMDRFNIAADDAPNAPLRGRAEPAPGPADHFRPRTGEAASSPAR